MQFVQYKIYRLLLYQSGRRRDSLAWNIACLTFLRIFITYPQPSKEFFVRPTKHYYNTCCSLMGKLFHNKEVAGSNFWGGKYFIYKLRTFVKVW